MRQSDFSRAQAHALVQPDPWEPTVETCEAVQEFAAQMVEHHYDARAEEGVDVCRMCGDVDSHNDGCPMPAIQAWIAGEN